MSKRKQYKPDFKARVSFPAAIASRRIPGLFPEKVN